MNRPTDLCPIVPLDFPDDRRARSGSGVRPRAIYRLALNMYLRDQRTGGIENRQATCLPPSSMIDWATPWALKIVTAPSGISSRLSTKDRSFCPRASRPQCRLWTISWRT